MDDPSKDVYEYQNSFEETKNLSFDKNASIDTPDGSFILDKVISAILVITAIIGFIFIIFTSDDEKSWPFIFLFGLWFSNLSIHALKDHIFPIIHYTVGVVLIFSSYITSLGMEVEQFFQIGLFQMDFYFYFPIGIVFFIYIFVIISRTSKSNYHLLIAKFLHLIYVYYIAYMLIKNIYF